MGLSLNYKNTVRNFLHLLYPPHCYICEKPLEVFEQKENAYLCKACKSRIEKVEGPFCICGTSLKGKDPLVDLCKSCANRIRYFDLVRSYGYYQKSLKDLIRAFKNQAEKELSRELSLLLKDVVLGLPSVFSSITYIPLSKIRFRSRGFNQTKLLASDLADLLNLEVVLTLEKVKRNLPQKGLSKADRQENVRGVFRCTGSGKGNILLVDDVYTSGATVNEVSRVLKEVGYEKIFVVTVARSKWG